MVVVDGMGVCDGAGGRQHGRVGVVLVADIMGEVGVVLVADIMGEWEEASGSLGFWDFILDFIIWVICWYGPGQKWAFTLFAYIWFKFRVF
ncbi:hypothetical protein E1A91_D12G027000v1 [Gossypium mustelinum]|uniref:Transmembrane protein n=1 Tax=Gossypium mustelinum TaxID=34275 RepID=A0A5D2S8Q7_GOSMU|nr:hypothetical protein E1A91_D12G027000v1 [Gossypium mustelinum]TYI49322.1 hypothetical protein E1A91_D12G027000v1 [Gossypium mustelinum]